MKTLVKTLVLSLSTTLITIPAMAAPQEHNSQHVDQHANSNHQQNHNSPKSSQHAEPNHQAQHANPASQKINKSINPSRDWKVGQRLPSQYHGKGYKINHTKYKRLSKPARNQQWIKINGDYVLVNVLNHNIIKIISN